MISKIQIRIDNNLIYLSICPTYISVTIKKDMASK